MCIPALQIESVNGGGGDGVRGEQKDLERTELKNKKIMNYRNDKANA